MATQNPQNLQLIIDKHFFVPVGAVDVRQQNDTDSENTSYIDNSDVALDDNQPTLGTPTATVPMPPTSYSIVDQRVRISADGTAVVDVTIEFPDIPGIDHFDVRITKTS